MDTQKLTMFQAWKKGLDGHLGHGSFLTNLFLAYRVAGEENIRILDKAYPQFFVEKKVEIIDSPCFM
jgi:hypothetical protein